nr:hypothetical protein [Tanacetum cinerariifolium]
DCVRGSAGGHGSVRRRAPAGPLQGRRRASGHRSARHSGQVPGHRRSACTGRHDRARVLRKRRHPQAKRCGSGSSGCQSA